MSLSMDNDKIGLDDYIMSRQNPVQDIEAMIARSSIYIPTAEGVSAFAEKKMSRGLGDLEGLIDGTAALLSKSETQTLQKLEALSLSGTKRAYVLKDARKKLSQATSRQTAKTRNKFKLPSDSVYAEPSRRLSGTSYLIDADGNMYHKEEEKNGVSLAKLSNFVAYPEKITSIDDGATIKKYLDVRGILHGGRVYQAVRVPIEKIPTFNFVLEQFGPEFNVESGFTIKDKLRHAFQCMAEGIPNHTVIGHIGWHLYGDKWIYFHAGGAVGVDGLDVEIDEHFVDHQQYRLEPTPNVTEKDAAEASLQLLDIAPLKITLPLLASVFNAVLLELFTQAQFPAGYSTMLIGKTGTMKSTLSALFLSHFGRFTTKSLTASFEDTVNTIEKKAFIAKDAMFVIDDIYPTSDRRERDRMERDLQSILRRFGNRLGRGRLSSNLNIRTTYNPRCLALITAEMADVPTSAMARSVELQLGAGTIDLAKLTTAQSRTYLLTTAMYNFICWLSQNFDETVQHITELYPRVRTTFQAPDVHPQLPEHCTAMYLSLDIFLTYAVEAGAIAQQEADSLLETAADILRENMTDQQQRMREESPVALFLETIQELLATKAVYLERKDAVEGSPRWPDRAECFGWEKAEDEYDDHYQPKQGGIRLGYLDDSFLYLIPGQTYSLVSASLQRQNRVMPFKDKSLWKALDEQGILVPVITTDRLYRTTPIAINGVTSKFIKLKRGFFPLDADNE